MRATKNWRLRTRTLALGPRTLVMGIVNVTPDSFSDGGHFFAPEAAVAQAAALLAEGADLLDIGGESTRPGSRAGDADALVGADEEQARLLPVIEEIVKTLPQAVLSVDTYKAATARAALAAGAEIVNDVSGFAWDAAMAQVCAERKAGVVLMHTRGHPGEWRELAPLENDALVAEVRRGLAWSLAAADRAGIARESIVLDPGYGFGKHGEENYALLARQAELLDLGCPLLVGLSRKSFLGHSLAPLYSGNDAPAGQRENASIAALTAAILHGAAIVRVHNARAAAEAARIADAVCNGL
jgi:dihydropteroate synthase